MKLWHDDIRRAPEGWTWVRTNEDAKHYLLNHLGEIDEMSMDHDLGLDHLDPEEYEELRITEPHRAHEIFTECRSEDSGFRLACWMVAEEKVPAKIIIHSWNPAGTQNMAHVFNAAGHDVLIDVFQP